MAKLSKILTIKNIPTSIPDLFIVDKPIGEFETIFAELTELLNAKDEAGAVSMIFSKLLVDSKGEQFEDALTKEDVKANMSVSMMQEVLMAIPEALNGINTKGN